MKKRFFHTLPTHLKTAISKNKKASSNWETLTPISKSEFVCWTISPKKEETKEKHIKRLVEDLQKGKRRPCCWGGCRCG